MIFYFSGTGNSLYTAKMIASHNKETVVSIAAEINSGKEKYMFALNDNELVGFVFPVYAWGPPEIVSGFLSKLFLENYLGNYIFAVITCGGSIGNTAGVIAKILDKKGYTLNSAFSLMMPNNYMIMGDVDKKEDVKVKLSSADRRISHINEIVKKRTGSIFELEKGPLPGLLTKIINPMFINHATRPEKFYADDNCTGCGVCASVCSCNNIAVNAKPEWGSRCIQCVACINYCPVSAIQFGKSTQGKGRYTNPNISADEISLANQQIFSFSR
jgi:ferredoxin